MMSSIAIDEALALLKRRDQLRGDVRAAMERADQGKLLDADAVFRGFSSARNISKPQRARRHKSSQTPRRRR
jgi:hypothetical protein